jgi:ferredoxin-thioredoxin reductase catalytic subunit
MIVYKDIQAENGKHLLLNTDKQVVGAIVYRCVQNGGYCPCNPYRTADKICPCANATQYGICCCHLYIEEHEDESMS